MNLYPELIRNLPLADLPFEGVEGHMLRSDDGLVIFFHFHRDVQVPHPLS
jgi:predicted regulator of Ras-like GTPase activity (Roadblock/LC7/MglB family)